jgi:hypothetical protein
MVGRVIFWLSADLLPFCISYFFQKNNNSELFGIYDLTNKPRKFFGKQTLTKFQKTWFYFDNIKKFHEVDLEYLKEFERKYQIDLNELTENDRILNKYNEYYNFSKNEILSILEDECRFFESVLDEVRPDYFITSETTLQPHHLFYKMCRKIGTKVLMLNHANWKTLCYISQERHKIDFFNKDELNESPKMNVTNLIQLFEESRVSNFHTKFHKTIKKSKTSLIAAALKFILSSNNSKTHYTYFGRSKLKVIRKEIEDVIKKNRRKKFIDANLVQEIKNNEKFIYLPLHQEPERSLLIAAPKFSDQLRTVEEISKVLPDNYRLYVKEHPTQGPARNWREIKFYERILELKNVKLIHPNFDSKFLFKNCELVVSVGGTSSFEAMFFGKPSLIFADLGYASIPSISKLDSYSELKQGVMECLKIQVEPRFVLKYLEILDENSFDFDILGFETAYQNQFYMNGNLVDIEFNQSDFKEFLHEHETELDSVAKEFNKKIEQFKLIRTNEVTD